jgi:hypothetical protein
LNSIGGSVDSKTINHYMVFTTDEFKLSRIFRSQIRPRCNIRLSYYSEYNRRLRVLKSFKIKVGKEILHFPGFQVFQDFTGFSCFTLSFITFFFDFEFEELLSIPFFSQVFFFISAFMVGFMSGSNFADLLPDPNIPVVRAEVKFGVRVRVEVRFGVRVGVRVKVRVRVRVEVRVGIRVKVAVVIWVGARFRVRLVLWIYG